MVDKPLILVKILEQYYTETEINLEIYLKGLEQKNIVPHIYMDRFYLKSYKLADYIIKYALERKYNETIELEVLDDSFEKSSQRTINKKIFRIKINGGKN